MCYDNTYNVREVTVWPSELQSKYGDIFEVYAGSKRQVWLCNEELARKLIDPFDRNFHNLIGEDCDISEIGFLNVGLATNLNYDSWARLRRFYAKTIASPLFMRQALIYTQNGFQRMEYYWEKLGEDSVLELPHWMRRYLME
ncbi:1425_t:CDS:2, partial [Acaulospora colombiana]